MASLVKSFFLQITSKNIFVILVGAGIARPTHADDSVKSQKIVPAELGRAMPAPTK